MSYYVADAKGYVGDLASGGGLHALFEFLGHHASGEIANLLDAGHTENPAGAAEELRALAPDAAGETLKSLSTLADLLDACDEIGIVSDGVETEVSAPAIVANAAGQKKKRPCCASEPLERFVR